MGDVMRGMSFGQLMNWILEEYRAGDSIFGVRRMPRHTNRQALPIFHEKIEAPFGPAAGPNTQLAQNTVAAYVTGARFFELKTVQVMDGEELAACVNKPCITAADECYNCEWSTELTVPEAFAEYVRAWFACKLLAKELGLGDPEGFVFNMSVGYDLEGIKSPKIDAYIEGMKDASGTEVWRECVEWTMANLDRFQEVDAAYVESIPARISDSITESTLHGCPPDEIERIASYLITEKHLNTYIKCNPTLLGYEFARERLDSLGFDYIAFDDHHFLEDLQWADAVPMFRRLSDLCRQHDVEFGLKLTNTFPVDVKAGELPSEEMYMSGRSLFPLTIALVRKISEEFGGELRISYSGGADIFNIEKLFAAGIWPITMATTVLKPGGYERFAQIGEALMNCGSEAFAGVDVDAVKEIEAEALAGWRNRKPVKPLPDRHIDRKLPLLDCFTAPCRSGCPIEQDIPAYLHAMEKGEPEEALRIILERNALPHITGTICPHHCADKCVRNYYEEALRIRETKLAAAEMGAVDSAVPLCNSAAPTAIIGGGPAGLSAAYFLSRAGADVTVFEKQETLGGVVRHVIPDFRISEETIEKDVAICKAHGAKFVTGREITSIRELQDEGFANVIVAVGAWKAGDARLEYGEALDAIEFLEACKKGEVRADAPEGCCAGDDKTPHLCCIGKEVVVIGGGNTAMDVARAAKRVPGVEHVRLVYRRTARYMPADEEELQMAQDDGVEFCELLAPVGVRDGVLTCRVCELGAPDASGRRAPVETGEIKEIPATAVIAAVGERIDTALYEGAQAALDEKGRPIVDEHMQTSVPGIYAAGDCRRGPATVVEGIADAMRAAEAILARAGSVLPATASQTESSPQTLSATRPKPARHQLADAHCVSTGLGHVLDQGFSENSLSGQQIQAEQPPRIGSAEDYRAKKGTLFADTVSRPDRRCLGCPAVCELCADVCPNRANVSIAVPGMELPQILHVDGMCNECGNCAVFCPYREGRPYRDKFTLFWSREDFDNSENEGFLPLENGRVLLRLDGRACEVGMDSTEFPEDMMNLIRVTTEKYTYLIK